MKSVAWRQHHLDTGDLALAEAGRLIGAKYPIEADLVHANALIALARAHYRAVEVETNARVTQ